MEGHGTVGFHSPAANGVVVVIRSSATRVHQCFPARLHVSGFVGRAATGDRDSASGIYLASYFLGGLVGTATLGQVFDRLGWAACVAGILASLAVAALLAARLIIPGTQSAPEANRAIPLNGATNGSTIGESR